VGQITVTIKNGKVEMEVENVRGGSCVELTEAVERILGKVDQPGAEARLLQAG
jgi:hypothetical protein